MTIASLIVNANHSIMSAAAMLRVVDCVADFQLPQPPEWQRIGNQVDAAIIFALADFLNVL
jgi:hypothetical protein